eukprot:751012-Hanusia_phi.AAC.1
MPDEGIVMITGLKLGTNGEGNPMSRAVDEQREVQKDARNELRDAAESKRLRQQMHQRQIVC